MNPVAKEYEEVKKTCSMETIEIGAVILDKDNREIASFREYIRPDYSADIRPRIQKLTGISWDMVEEAGSFAEVLERFVRWCGPQDYTIYSWSDNDIVQILQETELKVFSRIRCKKDYKPTKRTAVAFAIALKLDMPTMLDLLSRAEIAFSPSSRFDLIISYFVTNRRYDIYEINLVLFKYGQPTLGNSEE